MTLILASGSATRAAMLTQAGLIFERVSPDVDERAVEASLEGSDVGPDDVASILAEVKATEVSLGHPDDLVIGADQTLSLNAADQESPYVDRATIAQEVAYSRRLCTERGWPMIDVTRRSIEETAAAILALWDQHRYGKDPAAFA
jgi:hypothetical protein